MKKIIYTAIVFAALLATSCKKDLEKVEVEKPLIPGNNTIPGATVDTIRGLLTGNTNITTNTFIDGIVYVDAGAVLNIPAGITMIGKTTPFGTSPDLLNLANNKGTLVVQQGARIIANGTPASPIIWTSANPAGSRNPGDWGGLVILGSAPIETSTGAVTNIFEAFVGLNTVNPLANGRNSYGGTNAAETSGSVTYNCFSYGGGLVTAVNAEVNGVTLCGVGNGTTFNHNKVSNSADDAFQFFGGTVNASYLVSFSNKDDDFVFEEGYKGNLQFIIAYRSNLADNSGSVMLQVDNNKTTPPATAQRRTNPFIANATLIGPVSTIAAVNPGGAAQAGRFDAAVITQRGGRLFLVNSLIIAQAMPFAFVTTPSTDASFFPATGTGIPESPVYNNLFQTQSTVPVVLSFTEGIPVLPGGGIPNTALIAQLGAQGNTAPFTSFSSYNLGGFLQNQPTSASFTGGINLVSAGLPGFVGATERGAVISTNVWTSALWVSL
jgi:hypothetical protein